MPACYRIISDIETKHPEKHSTCPVQQSDRASLATPRLRTCLYHRTRDVKEGRYAYQATPSLVRTIGDPELFTRVAPGGLLRKDRDLLRLILKCCTGTLAFSSNLRAGGRCDPCHRSKGETPQREGETDDTDLKIADDDEDADDDEESFKFRRENDRFSGLGLTRLN